MIYTATQEKQMAYLDKREVYESLSSIDTYDGTCYTCKEKENGVVQIERGLYVWSIQLHTAGMMKQWVSKHAGHKTWIVTLGKQNPVTANRGRKF